MKQSLLILRNSHQSIILTIIAVTLVILINQNNYPKIVTADFYKINDQLLTFNSEEKSVFEKSIKRNDIFKQSLHRISSDQNLIILDNRLAKVGNKEDVTDQLLMLVADIKQNENVPKN